MFVGPRLHRAARLVVFLAALATTLLGPTAHAEKEHEKKIVFLGLRPLDKEGGASELKRLGEAQGLRSIAEGVLATASRQPVIGHEELKKLVGGDYLVRWFNCAGKLACIPTVVAALREAGYGAAVSGEYFVAEDGGYHIHLFSFSVADGKVGKEVDFTLATAEVKDVEQWKAKLMPLVETVGGQVRVVSDITGSKCLLDGEVCPIEADGHMNVRAGDHTIELSKEGYQSEKISVTVQTGSSQEVAVSLKPVVIGADGLAVGGVDGPRRAPKLTAVRTDTPPVIDGQLDDPAWQKAWLETNFTQNFPNEGTTPTERTALRVLYDDDAVYVAVQCFDKRPKEIVGRLTRRDRDIDGDKIAVIISSKNDKATASNFQVNAAGVQVDGIRFNDTDYSSDWDGRWYSATSRDDKGWIVEFKIPLVTLRYNGDVTSFGFQVRRWLGRNQEIDEWSYVPRTAKGEVSYYGSIEGITGLHAKRLFQILAYDSRQYTTRAGQGRFDGGDNGGNIGADLKIGLTPALALDATINPDFGTVEVDQVVLNLSTIETFFPEKRPFFVEGADLFATPFTLFYTRRVGAQPASPALTGTGVLLEPLGTGRVWTAARLTGVLGNRLSIALLDAVTSRTDATIQRAPNLNAQKVLVEPLTNYGVLRLRKDFGVNSSIGILATSVNRLEPANAAAPLPMDLCTTFVGPRNGRCTHDAYTGGVDTVLKSSDGDYGLAAQVVASRIEEGPTELVADGTVIGAGATGWGVNSEVGRYGGANWLYHFNYTNSSPRLQLNDAGFEGEANFHEATGSVVWRITKPTKHFQSFWVEGFLEHKRDWELKDNLSTAPEIHSALQFKNFWSMQFQTSPYFPKWVENRETQDGARTQRNAGNYEFISIKSDPNKAVVVEASTSFLKVYGGQTSLSGKVAIALRPYPALELDLISKVRWVYGTPRWIETQQNMDGSSTYYFMDLDAKSLDVTLRGTYTFTRKLTLQAYLQPFVASGHYTDLEQSTANVKNPLLKLESFTPASALPSGGNPDFRFGAINLNLFVRWEYLPLSALWLVFTHNQEQEPYDSAEGVGRLRFLPFKNGPTTDVVLVKLSYLWF